MTWELTDLDDLEVLLVKTTGALDSSSADAMAREAWEALLARGWVRCLIDHRDLTELPMTTSDIFERAKVLASLGVTGAIRLAAVHPPAFAADFRFFETACRNRGLVCALFADAASALDWLTR